MAQAERIKGGRSPGRTVATGAAPHCALAPRMPSSTQFQAPRRTRERREGCQLGGRDGGLGRARRHHPHALERHHLRAPGGTCARRQPYAEARGAAHGGGAWPFFPKTTFDNRIYALNLSCSDKYPQVPPTVKFVTKVNLPYISQTDGVVRTRRPLPTRRGLLSSRLGRAGASPQVPGPRRLARDGLHGHRTLQNQARHDQRDQPSPAAAAGGHQLLSGPLPRAGFGPCELRRRAAARPARMAGDTDRSTRWQGSGPLRW